MWQPIETAPKDGTPVLVAWRERRRPSIMWRQEKSVYPAFHNGQVDRCGTPVQYAEEWFTHWMPLPEPPQ